MSPHHRTGSRSAQRGVALLALLIIVLLATTYTLIGRLSSPGIDTERQARASTALAQAKEALIGFAITYRDSHPTPLSPPVFGYLPCPDTNNDGVSDACGLQDVSIIGRLPWKTLGLPPLRDGAGECLWYAVSGSAKDTPKTAIYNWDTTGQFIVLDAAGAVLAGATPHDRPLAVILSPGAPLGGKTHDSAGAIECDGSNTVTDYLEGIGALGVGTSNIVVASADSRHNGTNNDQATWISSREIFDRVRARSDFKTDVDALLDDITLCLNNLPPATLPAASAINKGVGDYALTANDVLSLCPPASPLKQNVMINLQNNLLYTKPAAASSLNGLPGCNAMLFFSGSRQGAQSRATPFEQASAANYLEGGNLALFPLDGAYASALSYSSTASSNDIARCIKGLPAGATQQSFANNFNTFSATGPGAGAAVTPDATSQTVVITDASGTGNGCFWSPNAVPLAGKTLRAYYEFQFSYADLFALLSAPTDPDRGNGFTFQMVQSFGLSAPNNCGTESALGALGSSDVWGSFSFIIETDVRKGAGEPVENHTAIMTNGSLAHGSGTLTTACNGTARGCRHSPANKFEESPAPLAHNQRIEIHTGCLPGCTGTCIPASHGIGTRIYAKISAWVDCSDCKDVATDLDQTTNPSTIQYCTATPLAAPEMNSVYFGFTGGFLSGATPGQAPAQGVTIRNFSLRSD